MVSGVRFDTRVSPCAIIIAQNGCFVKSFLQAVLDFFRTILSEDCAAIISQVPAFVKSHFHRLGNKSDQNIEIFPQERSIFVVRRQKIAHNVELGCIRSIVLQSTLRGLQPLALIQLHGVRFAH